MCEGWAPWARQPKTFLWAPAHRHFALVSCSTGQRPNAAAGHCSMVAQVFDMFIEPKVHADWLWRRLLDRLQWQESTRELVSDDSIVHEIPKLVPGCNRRVVKTWFKSPAPQRSRAALCTPSSSVIDAGHQVSPDKYILVRSMISSKIDQMLP